MALIDVVASLLTPITIAVVGFFIQRTLANQARQHSLHDRLLGKRMEVYEKVAENLNRIFCYVMDVGGFKNETPQKVISAKRDADKTMYIYQAIWPEDTFTAFLTFMHSAFAHYAGGVGGDAKIRADVSEKRGAYEHKGKRWPAEWDHLFSASRDPEHHEKYQRLMALISRDLEFLAKPARPWGTPEYPN